MKKLITLALAFISITLFGQNPQLLKDIFPGNNTGTIQRIVKTTNYTFFNQDDDDADTDQSLFRTDGTNAGTIKLNLTYPGYISTKADQLTALGNKVVFAGDNFQGYGEIWASDGTQAGTVAIERFQPINNKVPVVEINTMGSYAYYSVINKDAGNVNHAYLRRTDGTAGGTSLVYDFSAFTGVPQVVFLTPVNNILYFIVYDAEGTGVDQLWRSDGTTAGTYMVYNFTTTNFVESFIMPVGNTLYLMIGSVVGGVRQNTIWKSDGTTAGTVPVKLVGTGNANTYPPFAVIGSTLYFAGVDGNGKELWQTDGTAAGTIMVADINPGAAGSNPLGLTVLNNILYFSANNGTNGGELWKYSGGVASLVKDINPGSAGSGPGNSLTLSGNTIIFSANNGTNGGELWITDGTFKNTVMVADINPGAGNSVPNTFTGGNPVYFAANNGTNGFEVFKYDNNGDVLSGPRKYYVNDNSLTGDLFTLGLGNNSNNGSKAYPFATISYALTQVQAGDSIYVDAGTYSEQVTIDKGITIIGAGQNLTFVTNSAQLVAPPGPFTEYGLIQTTQGIGDVHIRDITATNGTPGDGHTIMVQAGGSVKNCKLINGGQSVFFRIPDASVKTAVVENNYMEPTGIGINCQGSALSTSMLNNTITRSGQGFYSGIFAGLDFGPVAQLTITNNIINNYYGIGMLVNSNSSNISENSILGTGNFAIQQYNGNTINATCNWYGSSDQYVVASKISGAVTFSPWLVNNADNDPVALGFQPVPGSCGGRQLFYVNDNSLTGDIYTTAVGNNANNGSPSAPLATITAALAKAQPGDFILVDAGSFTEVVNINKNITILGAGKGVTIINGPAGNITSYPNTSETGIIQTLNGLNEVNIENLTVDGTNSNEQHGIFIQGGGRVANCELRYVNDGFYFQYLSTQPRTGQGYNNYVHHINYVGSLFAGNGMIAIANNNVIDLTGAQYGIGFIAGYGGGGNVASFTASNNSIININGFGIMIGSLQTAQVHNNSLTRTTEYNSFIQNMHTVNIDATCNWYGTSDAGVIIAYITGAVTYGPWLSNGTDNDVAMGFQPLPNVCNGRQNKFYVNDNSLTGNVFTTAVGNDANAGIPSAPLLTISAALTKAQDGDSIFVDAGTYASTDITISKAVTILGTNYLLSPNDAIDKRILNSVRNTESIVTGATFVINTNNISIQGITMDPSANVGIFMNNLNYSNISIFKNRFKINSNQAAIVLRATGTSTIAVSSLVSSGFIVDDNRIEKYDATSNNDIIIDKVKNVTVNNNAFVVSGATLRTHSAIVMGNNGVVDGVQFSNNTIDNALTAIGATRVATSVFSNNKIYNTTNALVSNNSIPESASQEFVNNILDGNGGILPFIQYTRGGGTNSGSSSSLKVENNTITATAIPGTTTVLGSMNLIFQNSVLNPSLIVRGNTINYGGNLSTIEGQLIRPVMVRGNLKSALIEKNEITLNGSNLQPKTLGNSLPVCPAITVYPDNGATSFIQTGSVINVLNNKIHGFKHSVVIFDAVNGVDPYIGFGNLPAGVTMNVNYNSFTGDSISINNGTASTEINANCNWYGSSADQNFIDKISLETVNPVPWLTNGTDNDPAVGFQPVAGACDGYPPMIVLDNYTNVTCNGANNGTINITTAYGKAPFTYTWSKDGDAGFVLHDEDPTGLAPGTYHLSVVDGNGSTIFINSFDGDGLGSITVTITEPTVLTANANGTNVSCNGGNNGTASVTAGGGTTPYSYSWSNGSTNASITNLTAGLYTVTVTDGNGCTKTASYQVTQPSILTASGSGTNVSCYGGNNGTATVTAGGGTLPYSYLWSNGGTTATINNLTIGLYSVTVTDGNGCTKTASYQVTQPTLLTAVATGTSTSCANSATVVASGGTTPYSYSWSNGATTQSITSLPAGTFTVTVTDGNGCQTTASCTVTATEAFNPSASVVNVNCYGGSNGSITVTNANGVAPFQYSINGVSFQSSNTFSGLAAGTYTVTVKDVNGCTGFVSKTITQPTQFVVTQGTVQNTCAGFSTGAITINVSGGSPSYSYLWSGPGGYSSTQGSISGLAAGNYNVIVTDSKGCTASLPVTVNPFPAINVNANVINVACRGDASGSIDLTVTGGTGSGFTYLWNNGATTQDRINLTNGSYNVTITDIGSGCVVTVSYSITQPASVLSLSATSTNVTGCNTLGTITATGSGGTAPYQYKLNANGTYQSSGLFTGLPAGADTVWVKDANGCIKSVTKTINDGGGDDFENNNNKNNAAAINLGATISARIGTVGDIDYFKLGPANTWTGTYTVSFVQPATAVVFDLVGSNGSTIITPTSSTSTYKQYTGLNGTYFVRVSGTNSLNCYQLTVTSGLLTRSSGSSNIQQEVTKAKPSKNVFNVGAYPNPSNTSFNIEVESSSDELMNMRIMDASGRLIEERKNIPSSQIVKLGERYINGVYLVEIVQGNNRKAVRLVKM